MHRSPAARHSRTSQNENTISSNRWACINAEIETNHQKKLVSWFLFKLYFIFTNRLTNSQQPIVAILSESLRLIYHFRAESIHFPSTCPFNLQSDSEDRAVFWHFQKNSTKSNRHFFLWLHVNQMFMQKIKIHNN